MIPDTSLFLTVMLARKSHFSSYFLLILFVSFHISIIIITEPRYFIYLHSFFPFMNSSFISVLISIHHHISIMTITEPTLLYFSISRSFLSLIPLLIQSNSIHDHRRRRLHAAEAGRLPSHGAAPRPSFPHAASPLLIRGRFAMRFVSEGAQRREEWLDVNLMHPQVTHWRRKMCVCEATGKKKEIVCLIYSGF